MRRGYLRHLVVSFAFLVTCALLLVLWITPKTDLSFVFPRNPSPDIELLVERLQKGPSAAVLLLSVTSVPADPLSPEALAGLSNRLVQRLNDSGRFQFVTNGEIRPPGPEISVLFDKRYLLNPPVTAADFGVPALRAGLERSLEELHSGFAAATKALLPADPTGRLRDVLEFWQGATAGGRAGGIWLSRDQSAALIMAHSLGPAYDLGQQQDTLEFIQQSFQEVRQGMAAHLEMTGPAVFAAQSRRIIQQEMRTLTILSGLFVVALLYLAFRSFALILAFLLPLGFGLCAGIAAVQAIFGEIHGVTLAFGGTLIGIAVDYPLHLISHRSGKDDSYATLERIWPTLRLGMLTTAAAFFAITLSSFQGLGQLGLFAMSGILSAALVTRWLLPSVLPPDPPPAVSALWSRRWISPRQARITQLLILALLVPAVVQIMVARATLWETDLRNLSPIPQAARDLDRQLRNQMGASDVRYLLVIRKASLEEVLQESEALVPDLEALIIRGEAVSFDMAARYLPSLQSQQQKREALPSRAVLQPAIEMAAAGLPFRPGLFEPFLAGVAQSKNGPPLVMEDFTKAGIGWILAALVFQQAGDWVGLIAPQGLTNPGALANLVAGRNDPGLSFLDLKIGSQMLVADYRQEALLWLALGAVLAVVLLWFGLRSLGRVVRVMLPVSLSIIFTVALLSGSGTALSLFHVLSLLLVAGVGLDYALFFERYSGQSEERVRTLRANLLCAVTTVTVFTILAFSHIPVLQGLGQTVAIGAFFSLVLTFIFTLPGGGEDI